MNSGLGTNKLGPGVKRLGTNVRGGWNWPCPTHSCVRHNAHHITILLVAGNSPRNLGVTFHSRCAVSRCGRNCGIKHFYLHSGIHLRVLYKLKLEASISTVATEFLGCTRQLRKNTAGVEFHDGNHGKCRDFFSLYHESMTLFKFGL